MGGRTVASGVQVIVPKIIQSLWKGNQLQGSSPPKKVNPTVHINASIGLIIMKVYTKRKNMQLESIRFR